MAYVGKKGRAEGGRDGGVKQRRVCGRSSLLQWPWWPRRAPRAHDVFDCIFGILHNAFATSSLYMYFVKGWCVTVVPLRSTEYSVPRL